MLLPFFQTLRAAQLPVSPKEFLTLLEALRAGVIGPSLDEFYSLARTILVKDEALYDKFDRAFQAFVKGSELQLAELARLLPEDWLKQQLQLELSPEERAKLEALGWDELMDTLKKRLEEQKERHEGGNRWIGTGGTSPFGNGGANPAGVRIGGKGGGKSAVKVWEQRGYRDYDDAKELGTRNIKLALRRLRRFAREGAADEFALDDTIQATAANAGLLDIKMRPERHNKVKVLLLMDVGGTMDEHIHRVEELFSAAKAEFKHMEFFYFHNCVYDHVWKNNRRRHAERTPTWDLIHKFNRDWKLVFVGDATMSPYEILQPGGSVESMNEEAGSVWMDRLTQHFNKHVWINPEPQGIWGYRQSIELMQRLVHGRMHPLTLAGLDGAMRELQR